MKSNSRLLTILIVILIVIMLFNLIPTIQKKFGSVTIGKSVTSLFQANTPVPPVATLPATITVNGKQWGQSTCYIGATEGSSRFNIADLTDLGINTYHIYGGMSRWEPKDDSTVYGLPTIAQIKSNPNVINWKIWDNVMTNPPNGSDYSWQSAPRWQGNARTLLGDLQAAHIRVILNLRNRDDQNQPSWSPNPPVTTADWNEWWEHVFATIYWLDVRNHYNVSDFEIQNEPNAPYQGWAPQATEEQYFTFTKYTSDAISYVFHTYLPGQRFHIYAPVTSGGHWDVDSLKQVSQYFDSMDNHVYYNYTQSVESIHDWMSATGHANEPLWITEWGSYKFEYASEPFGVGLINDLISGSFPGVDYVYGNTIFALYDYNTSPVGLIDYKGNRRIDYYAMRMGIRALQGCRPTYQSVSSNKDLLAITTVDTDKNIYLLVTNTNMHTAYTVQANLSALQTSASGTMWQYGNGALDTVVSQPTLSNGAASLISPASSAILVKFFHARILAGE